MLGLGLGLKIGDGGASSAPAPPGAPAIWLRADKQALGPVNTWADLSGNGNSLTVPSGASAPTNTAGAGPGGTLPAVVFTGTSTDVLHIASALGIGTKNFTIAIIVQAASASAAEAFLSVGNTSSGTCLTISSSTRNPAQLGGVGAISDGASSASWEAWVFTSDASGNFTFTVNGVNKSVSPASGTAAAASADFTVGAFSNFNSPMTGSVLEVLAWATAQNNATVADYQLAWSGV